MCVVTGSGGDDVSVVEVEDVEVVEDDSRLLELVVVEVCEGDEVSEVTVLDGAAEVGAADAVVGGRRSMVLMSFSSTLSTPAMVAEARQRPSSKNVDRILADEWSDQPGPADLYRGRATGRKQRLDCERS